MKDAAEALPQNLRRPIPEQENMNILMVSIDYPPVPGGISAHVYELSKAFAKASHRVAVITRRRGDEAEHSTEDGWEVYRVLSFL